MKISACVITKNEEKNLPQCLASVKDVVSEIIVVDTGSTDRTVEVAEGLGAAVYHYQWENDFSKARNFAIKKAAGDWIIFLDADEYFTQESIPQISKVISQCQAKGFEAIVVLLINYEKTTNVVINSCPAVRIFKNDPNISYAGAVHERPVHRRRLIKQADASRDLKIIHTGYSRDIVKDKGARNLQILLEEERKRPGDGELCYYIAESYIADQEYEKGLDYASKAVTGTRRTILSGVREKNYYNLILCMAKLEYPTPAIIAKLKEAIETFPNYPDFYFYLGDFYKKDYRFHDAIEVYEQGLRYIDQGLKSQSQAGFAAANVIEVLGELYYQTGQMAKSLERFVSTLRIDRFSYFPLKRVLLLLTNSEATPRIIDFLKKIYDPAETKNLIYLLRASLDINSPGLAECFFSLIPSEYQKLLAVESFRLNLLRGNYTEAAAGFFKMYNEKPDRDYLQMSLISAWLGNDDDSLQAIAGLDGGASRFIAWISGQDIRLNEGDRSFFLDIMRKLIKLKQNELLFKMINAAGELDICLKAGEMLYYNEIYDLAGEFYNLYLEKEPELPDDVLADVLIKMAHGLDKTGQPELALAFLKDAQAITPGDYRVYEYALTIGERLKDLTQTRAFAELGLKYYPDSNFIISAMKNSNQL